MHEHLGKFHPKDGRTGWINGLPEEEGKKDPIIAGLRIGKKSLERDPSDPFNERLEWDRDGQYFHYITQWINALLLAQKETGEKKYGIWACELILATKKFIYKIGDTVRMYWKMSTNLSHPLVPSMGAHDPLAGMISAKSIVHQLPDKKDALSGLIQDFKKMCEGQNWSTPDALGIGGLLLNTVRTAELNCYGIKLQSELKPERLLADGLTGLHTYATQIYKSDQPANYRLAFRECGLSLGLRVLSGQKTLFSTLQLDLDAVHRFMPLAEDIENFWADPINQQAGTWKDQLDINQVSLASSLAARVAPETFM